MKEKKQYGFWRLLLMIIFAVCSTTTISAQIKVTSLSQLKAGNVIKIYPKDSNGTSHYGESKYALACSGNQNSLTSYEKAGSGDSWTLVDAGSGYYYLKNNLGCYWAYQGKSSSTSLTCTASQSSAVKVSLTWDSKYGGVCFWNQKDGTGLNNLFNNNNRYNWWSSKSDYNSSDANTTFDVAIEDFVDIVNFAFNPKSKTATVLRGNYGGDVVIPQSVVYDGNDYVVTSLENKCFYDCRYLTSIILPNSITSIPDECFHGCRSLTSVSLPNNIASLGNNCFISCDKLETINLPNSIISIGNGCFAFCRSLKSVILPTSITKLSKDCFNGAGLTNILIPEGVVSLEPYCFAGCTKLTEIILPSTLTNCYSDIWGLGTPEFGNNKMIACLAAIPPVAASNFIGSYCNLYVPSKAIEQYKNTSPWNRAFSISPLYPIEAISLSKECSIARTKTKKLDYSILPQNEGPKIVTWSSENLNVASVDANGVITGKAIGATNIIATAADGSGVSATCKVEVTPLLVSDISTQTTSVVKTIPTEMEMSITPAEADNQKLKWTSLTPNVATVTEDGMVTGLKMGTAKLQAESTDGSNIARTFDVQVTGLPVSTISMPKEASIVKTEKQKFEYTILPLASDNQKLKWSSNAPTIASVDETSGVITAHKVGDAVITATATDGSGVSASTMIHVIPLEVSHIEITKELSLLRTMTGQIETTIEPEFADNKTLKWESDNENIATVTQKGVVKGVNVGTANITATTTDGSNVSATCKVTVTPITIDLSTKTINLQQGAIYSEQEVKVLPDNYEYKAISWSSSDPSVASIDANGKIKANKPGIATIRYVLNKDNNIYADCKVIVYAPSVVYVGGLYYLLDGKSNTATVTGIYGANGNGLDASRVAQYYSGTINIPRSVTYNGITYDVTNVGSYSFACQNDLQSIFIPTSVKTVERSASTKAEKLQMVNVEEESQLVNIGENAFKECTGLRFFTFEGTTMKMKSIDASAFYGCSKLERVKWVGKSTLMTIGDYAFYKCTSLNNFAMPNSVLSVGNYSFRYCAGLTNVSLSSTLSIIYEYAFGECGFSHITLPESLVSVQAGSFINNQYLEDITFPARMEGIGSAAFENNASLGTVTFKTEINTMTIGDNAFNLCPALSKVNIEHLDSWAHTNFKNAKANPANTSHNIYMNGVEIIDVVLPTGTRYVNNNAFNGCSHIKSLSMPATIDRINDNIIYGCSNLKDVYCYATEVPPFIGTQDPAEMDDVFKAATLHVIYGNENAYKADSWWGRFAQVAGCNAPAPDPIKVESITISQTEATLKPDDTIQLTATVYPTNADNKKINWKSSNENVAMVTDEGFVLALAEGTSDIIAEAADGSGIKAVCKITVEKKPSPDVKLSLIEFVNSAVTIEQGKSVLLEVNYYPENATNKQLNWTSARASVATVNDKGVVTAVGEGKTIITAKSTDGTGLSINCVVTVTPATGIGNITMGDVKLVVKDRHLKIEGLADNNIVQIINTIGFTVYKGTEHEIDLKAAGVYIIKVKGKTLKFSVK